MRRVAIVLPAASGVLVNTSGCLLMHATRETSGANPAIYRLFDGSSANGKLLLPVSLLASESTRDNWWRCVLPFRQGLFYQATSGTVEGTVTVLIDHDCEDHWRREIERAVQAVIA